MFFLLCFEDLIYKCFFRCFHCLFVFIQREVKMQSEQPSAPVSKNVFSHFKFRNYEVSGSTLGVFIFEFSIQTLGITIKQTCYRFLLQKYICNEFIYFIFIVSCIGFIFKLVGSQQMEVAQGYMSAGCCLAVCVCMREAYVQQWTSTV